MSAIYCDRLGFVNLGGARQSPIEACAPNEEDHSRVGKDAGVPEERSSLGQGEEDRLGKVAASPNSQNLSGRSIELEFVLFSVDVPFIQKAVAAGVQSIIIDWETIGKKARQASADTQINTHTFEDLLKVRQATDAHLIVRLNGVYAETHLEILRAIEGGADEILIPMVKSGGEVEFVLNKAKGEIGVGILVETCEAVELAKELAQFPLSRVYVGLNDLAIARCSSNIFIPIADGTLENIRREFLHLPFGFGGLTLPGRGFPIPCSLLMGEMVRLRCQFSFLRRSFTADVQGKSLEMEVSRMKEALRETSLLKIEMVQKMHDELVDKIVAWNPC